MKPPGEGEERAARVLVEWAVLDDLLDLPGLLTSDERARAERMVEPHGSRWARGRAFVRQRLGVALAVAPERVSLNADPGGRPRVGQPHERPPEISISHSRTVIALALGGRPLGVDVEDLPRAADLLGVAAVVADPRELAELAALHERAAEELPAGFQRWWVRKEAVLKAQGTGFLADPRAVHVGVGVGSAAPPPPWLVHDLGLVGPAGAALAVATDRRVEVDVHRRG